MKSFIFFLLFSMTSAWAVAQNNLMPQFDNVPYFYEDSTKPLKEVERAQYRFQTREKGMYGTQSVIIVPGPQAKTRYSINQPLAFVVRFSDARTRPDGLIRLVAFTINEKKKQREYVFQTAGVGHAETQDGSLPITFKTLGPGLYLITLNEKPAAGEYALVLDKVQEGYVFGIE